MNVVRIVAVGLTGEDNVHRMVDVVIPLRIVELYFVAGVRGEITGAIVGVLENEMHMPILADGSSNGFS